MTPATASSGHAVQDISDSGGDSGGGGRVARLDMRLTAEHKRLVEQAAALSGQSMSDYAVSHLVEQAQATLQDATLTRLSARDRDTFLQLLDSDVKPNAALKRAAQRYKRDQAARG